MIFSRERYAEVHNMFHAPCPFDTQDAHGAFMHIFYYGRSQDCTTVSKIVRPYLRLHTFTERLLGNNCDSCNIQHTMMALIHPFNRPAVMITYLSFIFTLICLSFKPLSAQLTNEELMYIDTTKIIGQNTLEQIYRSRCTIVHHNFNETFNETNYFEKYISGENFPEYSYTFEEQLTQMCPNGTNISVSRPYQISRYQTTGRLYVGHQTRFLIKGNIDLNGIRDFVGTSSNAVVIPQEQPKVAMQVSSSHHI